VPRDRHQVVTLGSIVITKTFNAFLAVGPSKLTVDGKEYFIVTPLSPLGRVLGGLKEGSEFTFNKRPNTVVEVY
jgi:transcription elongation GreA/GreB family factor